MAAKRFRSKIDTWLLFVLFVAMGVDIAAIARIALHPADPLRTTAAILVGIAALLLILSVMLNTHYTVDRGTLRVVSGPFRWTIPIDRITSVEASRKPWSSPAMSLDRLDIRYGNRRRILVSPADKPGFLQAIGHD